jgi:hypothetical protein
MNAPTYPVVEERALGAPGRTGFLGLFGRRREASEIPVAAAHQVLVYRSGGSFHVDKGGMALDDNRVLEADHVSLVDVGYDVLVDVGLSVPSAEDDDFAVRASFACTVQDPVAVVSEGRGDAHRFLSGHLRQYDKLPQVTQDLRLEDVNQVRALVRSHVRAFVDLAPPEVRGMRIAFVGTQVETPASLRKSREDRRTTAHDHEMERTRTLHEYDLKQMVTDKTREIMRGLSESVQDDTIKAVMFALAQGDIGPAEVAQRITHERERVLFHEEKRAEAEREERRLREERDREERRMREERDHEVVRRRETWEREDQLTRARLRAELAQTALRHNYMDGPISVSEVVETIHSELFATPGEQVAPGGAEAVEGGVVDGDVVVEADTDGPAGPEGTGERPGAHAAEPARTDEPSPAPRERGGPRFGEALSEDDHGA